MTENYVLELKDVGKKYIHPSGQHISALQNIKLQIKKGSLTVIQGPSGSGKSSLLKIIGFIEKPSQGSLIFHEKEIKEISQQERSNLIKKEVGFILKRDNLLSYLNILENVMLPMVDSDSERARELLSKVGFSEFKICPKELSPLELQKVALVRAMINQPSLILADEVTAELNSIETEEYMKLLSHLKNDFTIVMVTDNPHLSKYADKYLEIENGFIITS